MRQSGTLKLAFLAAALITASAEAHFTNLGFWKLSGPFLRFYTSAQNVGVNTCSAYVTIQTANAAGVTTNVASNLTVNLAATAMTFYSDSSCTTPITSITISSGSSYNSFYFVPTAIGASTITATATSYLQGIQTENVISNNFIWTGGGANANWSTAANWSGGVVPGSSNQAVFDGTCSSNCSPNITSSISIAGIRILAAYTGTITQNSGQTITIGSTGWYQEGGTFAGGDSNITVGGAFALSGGTFTSTSATFRENGAAITISNSPTFNHHNGKFEIITNSTPTLNGVSGISFYNVDILGNGGSAYVTLNSNMNVLGSLAFKDFGYASQFRGTATINVSGNLTNEGALWSVVPTIKMIGTGTITGSGSGSYFGPVEIATSGTITFATTGSADFAGNFTYTSGTVVTTNSTVRLVGANAVTVNSGSVIFNNLTFSQGATSADTITGTVYVGGNLSIVETAYWPSMNGGTIEVKGDLSVSGGWQGGTTSIVLTGGGVQNMTRSGTSYFPGTNITVNNASSVLTLGSAVTLNATQGIVVTAGSVNMAGYAFSMKSLTLNSNTLTKNGGTLTVNGSAAGTGSLFGGTVNP